MNDLYEILKTIISNEQTPERVYQLSLSISISFIGIGMTLFTVIHSFIEGKKSLVKSYEKSIKEGISGPFEESEMIFGKEYIKQHKKINKWVMIFVFVSVMLFFTSVIATIARIQNIYFFLYTCFLTVINIMIIPLSIYCYLVFYLDRVYHKTIREIMHDWLRSCIKNT